MKTLMLAAAAAVAMLSGATQAATIPDGAKVKTKSGILLGGEAVDISGLACRPPEADGARTCVVVDDQASHAQIVRLTGDSMVVNPQVIPLATTAPTDTFGNEPSVSNPCLEKGKFGERDGEAAAFDGEWFYVAGSHGCGRKSGKYKASSLQIARFKLDAAGNAVGLKNTFRLHEALATGEWGSKFLHELSPEKDGLNIEGFAVMGGEAYVGLRAPAGTAGRLTILKTPVAGLFASGGRVSAEAIYVTLRPKLGIRDLAPLGANHLVILYGPAQEQESPYGLALYDLTAKCRVDLGELPLVKGDTEDKKPAKAEAVMALGTSVADGFVVMFDGAEGGGARIYKPVAPGTCS